jgi:hypothetical protein
MALKRELESLEGLPDAIKELYAEQDGKFVLSEVEGMVSQDRLREFRDNNIKLMREREDLQKKLATYGDVDPEKYQEALKKLQDLDDKKMLDEGKIEELLNARTERLRTDYETQLKGFTKKVTELETSHAKLLEDLSRERIDGRLREVAPKIGIEDTGISDFIRRGREVWKLVDGEAVAMSGEQPIYGKDPSQRISMEEWGAGLAPEAPHLFKRSSGSGAQNSGNGAAHGARVIPRGDPLAFGKNAAEIATGKVVVQ